MVLVDGTFIILEFSALLEYRRARAAFLSYPLAALARICTRVPFFVSLIQFFAAAAAAREIYFVRHFSHRVFASEGYLITRLFTCFLLCKPNPVYRRLRAGSTIPCSVDRVLRTACDNGTPPFTVSPL